MERQNYFAEIRRLEEYFLHTSKPDFLATKPVPQFLATLTETAFKKIMEVAPHKAYNKLPNTVHIEGAHLPDSKTLHVIELYFTNGLWNLRYIGPVLSKQELDAERIDTVFKNARNGDRIILISGQKEGHYATFKTYLGNSIRVVLDDGTEFNASPGSARLVKKKMAPRINQESAEHVIAPRKIVFEEKEDGSNSVASAESDEEFSGVEGTGEEIPSSHTKFSESLSPNQVDKFKRLLHLLHSKKQIEVEIQTIVDSLYRDTDNDRDLNVIPFTHYVPPKPKVVNQAPKPVIESVATHVAIDATKIQPKLMRGVPEAQTLSLPSDNIRNDTLTGSTPKQQRPDIETIPIIPRLKNANKGDPVLVVGGAYAGKSGKFVHFNGIISNSVKVKLDDGRECAPSADNVVRVKQNNTSPHSPLD